MHQTTIEIDTKQFIKNICSVKKHIGQEKLFCLPVKANAYGHGLEGISKIAEPYIDALAVSCLSEGEVLRKIGIQKPILVFGAVCEDEIPGLIDNNLEITISSLFKAKLASNIAAKTSKKCKVHLKIDTGMNRIGVRSESAKPLIDFLLDCNNLELAGVYSHLANSDSEDGYELTCRQLELFKNVATYVKQKKNNVICHIANSGGVLSYKDSYLDMVRPGILSYGYFPLYISGRSLHLKNEIKPCLTLKSKVAYFKTVENNMGISYCHTYKTEEFTRVVTIPIGYGDGYRRAFSNIAPVLIRENKYRISGNICMDMFMVDIGKNGTSYVGDEVVLIGKQGNNEISAETLASLAETITYEILCSFNNRIPRIYV